MIDTETLVSVTTEAFDAASRMLRQSRIGTDVRFVAAGSTAVIVALHTMNAYADPGIPDLVSPACGVRQSTSAKYTSKSFADCTAAGITRETVIDAPLVCPAECTVRFAAAVLTAAISAAVYRSSTPLAVDVT
jgi:hypothetical protein